MGVPVTATEADLMADLQELNHECHRLNRRMELAALRQKFSSDVEEVNRAAADEQRWLRELDRTMTRFRAVEGQLRQIRSEV